MSFSFAPGPAGAPHDEGASLRPGRWLFLALPLPNQV
jgi:hypothetical protein